MTYYLGKIHCHVMVAIHLVYSHISIRWYQFRPTVIIIMDVISKGKVICRSFCQSTGQMPGWESKIVQYWGEFRIDSTEMEMMATLQNLSDNSMQAGLKAARKISCSPWFPAVSSPAFSWISAVDYLTPHPLIPKPRFRSTLNIDIAIFDFRLQPFGIFSPLPSDFVH